MPISKWSGVNWKIFLKGLQKKKTHDSWKICCNDQRESRKINTRVFKVDDIRVNNELIEGKIYDDRIKMCGRITISCKVGSTVQRLDLNSDKFS